MGLETVSPLLGFSAALHRALQMGLNVWKAHPHPLKIGVLPRAKLAAPTRAPDLVSAGVSEQSPPGKHWEVPGAGMGLVPPATYSHLLGVWQRRTSAVKTHFKKPGKGLGSWFSGRALA